MPDGSKEVESEKKHYHHLRGSKLLFAATKEGTIEISDAYTKQKLYVYDKQGIKNYSFEGDPKEFLSFLKNSNPFYQRMIDKRDKLLSGFFVSELDRKKASAITEYLDSIDGIDRLEDPAGINQIINKLERFDFEDVKKYRGINFFNKNCETIEVVKSFIENLNTHFPNLISEGNEEKNLDSCDGDNSELVI